MQTIRKAVIPVAGFGTRFLPATIAQPKEMLPIVDQPIIQYIVEELVASGITEIIFVTGRGKRAIEDHFDYSPELEELLIERGKIAELKEVRRISNLARFVYVRQNKPLGNGHAILCAKEVVGDEPFVVAFGDDIIDAHVPAALQCMRVFERYGDTVIGVTAVPKERVGGYGIVQPKERGAMGPAFEMKGIVEKPNVRTTPSFFGVRGRYVFTPAIFEALEKTKAGKGGEIWIADAVKKLLHKHPAYACVMEGDVYDCGNKLDYLKAQVAFALRRPDLGKDFRKFLVSV